MNTDGKQKTRVLAAATASPFGESFDTASRLWSSRWESVLLSLKVPASLANFLTTDFTDFTDGKKEIRSTWFHPCHPVIRGYSSSMKHEELTGDIIGAAMAVLNELKPGLDEKLYENALLIELVARGHTVEQQREYPVHYRGHFIGKLVPDLIVDGKVIADPKVVSAFNDTHIAQMLGYLNITRAGVGAAVEF
jgi:GxxExxY protein